MIFFQKATNNGQDDHISKVYRLPKNLYKRRKRPPQPNPNPIISFSDSMVSLKRKHGNDIAALYEHYCALYDQFCKDNPKLSTFEAIQVFDFALELNGLWEGLEDE